MIIKLPVPIKNYRVRSRTIHPDTGKPLELHLIELFSDGKLYCDCIAGKMGRLCWHKIKVYNYVSRNEPEKMLKPIRIKKKADKGSKTLKKSSCRD